jgi:hypothetical protein
MSNVLNDSFSGFVSTQLAKVGQEHITAADGRRVSFRALEKPEGAVYEESFDYRVQIDDINSSEWISITVRRDPTTGSFVKTTDVAHSVGDTEYEVFQPAVVTELTVSEVDMIMSGLFSA